MTLQIKDRRAVPEGRRKTVPTTGHSLEGREGAGGECGGSKLQHCVRQDRNSFGRLPLARNETCLVLRWNGSVDAARKCRNPEPGNEVRALTPFCAAAHTAEPEGCPEPARHRRVVNRPAMGVTTRRPDEPCVNSTSTVL